MTYRTLYHTFPHLPKALHKPSLKCQGKSQMGRLRLSTEPRPPPRFGAFYVVKGVGVKTRDVVRGFRKDRLYLPQELIWFISTHQLKDRPRVLA